MKINLNISIKFIFFLFAFVIASTITVKAQLPTVYFNKVFNATNPSGNSVNITTQLTGTNFKFVGDQAGTNGVFVNGSYVAGKLMYFNTQGANVIYTGKINLRDADGSTIYGFLFEQTSGGSAMFYVTNPRFDANRTGNATYTLNSGQVDDILNDLRNAQVVLQANYFVTNFNTCLNTASTAQTFTVSGSKLVSDVTVTAPTNFEVSKDNITYSTSISFARAGDNTLATSTVYLRMTSIASTGSYSGNVVVSATNAASQTLLATGNVNATTAISAQPSNVTICSGNATTFSLTAAGASLTYQWKVSTDGTNYTDLTNTGIYTGATTSVLRLSSGVTSSYSGYKYKCTVTGSCGSAVTSNEATLTVNSPISISASPSSSTICSGNNTTFSVTASGTSPTYQWKVSTNGGSSYSNLSDAGVYTGVTTATLTITGATAGMNSYKYHCVVSGTCANATSDAATLTINAAPSTPGAIAGNSTICSNTNQSYSITSVSGATSYSWIIPGDWSGTSTTNSINVVNSSTSGTLQVRAENSCGNSSYQTLAITVSGTSAPTPSFTINNQEQCLLSNSFAFTNASTAASGTTLSSSLWNFGDGSSESSTTSPTKAYAATGTYVVSLKVTASNGCVSSLNKQVVVDAAPTGQISGTTSICSGSSASLTITLTGQGPWLLNYTGASSPISISSSPYTLSVSPTTTTTYTITSLSDAKCSAAAGDMTGSATVTVNSNVTPAVTISSSDADNSICDGNSVTFSSSGLSNEGASPAYQWLKNGVAIPTSGTSNTYTTTALVNNDIISLQLVSNSTSCLTTNTVVSNSIQTQVNPGAPATPLAIAGDTTQCTSLTNQVYSITSVLNASTYTWSVPAGWTINSGNGTTSIVTTIGSSTGTSNVTVTAGNGCGTSTQQLLPVAVSSSSSNPITLSSDANTDAQTKCINTAITNITYSASGGSNVRFTGLPTGVSGSYSSSTVTITGTPSVSGTYNYVVTLTVGGCDYTKTGTITVTAANTTGVASSSPTLCINTALTSITHTTTGATGVGSATNLPAGVSALWSSNTITISGTPTESGTFNYSIPLSGGCGSVSASGTIIVTAAKTISLGGGSSSTQSICLNSALSSISYSSTGATGAVFGGLPSGVSGSYSSGTSTISGTPTVAGTFNYTVNTTGGCGSAAASGTITVKSLPSPATISSNNSPICAGFDAEFSVTGASNAVLTYKINAGSNVTITLGNGNGNGTITAAAATSNQTLTLVSIQDASTSCVTSLSATSTVSIRSDDEWTARGNSDVYHNSSNWCKNGVPGSSANIVIPIVSNNKYPKLTGNDAEVTGIQINTGATIDLNGRKLVINGNVTGSGKFTGGSGSTLEFTGTGAVGTIYLDQTSSSTSTIGTLKINRSSSGSVSLGSNAIVNTLDLTAGNIDIGNNNLTVTTSSNASSNSFIKVSGTGKVKRSIANGSNFTFPVGKSAYNPITITNNTGASDEFSINLLDEVYASYDATTGVGTTPMTGPRVTRTWNIEKTNANASSGINLTFNWNSGEVAGTINTPALYHFKSGAWVKQTGTTSSPTSTSFTFTGYTGTFSPFSIGDANTNLPVTWLSFTAAKQFNTVQLNWATASETNTRDFVVEYSNNAQQWTSLFTIPAAGNSTTTRNYSYVHQNPLKGNSYNYYRILQRDLDDKFSYSKIVSIIFNEPGADLQVYPNPVQDQLTIFLAETQLVRLVNAAGATVWKGQLPAGRNKIPVHTYSKGVYVLTAGMQSQSVLIQ